MTVAAEVRTVNSRYFKLTVRAGDSFLALEPRIESLVRKRIRRGTVQIALRVDREVAPDQYQLSEAALRSYHRQLEQLSREWQIAEPVGLQMLLGLPGVVDDGAADAGIAEAEWPVIEGALREALANLDSMRRDEGRAMAEDMEGNCQKILDELDQIAVQTPRVADAYRARLIDRLNKILSDFETQIEPADVVREVGIFAERSDISEELVRLRSHIDQFRSIAKMAESSGRKLDFLTQEMFREANTIGSKANDAVIAGHVVEVKAMIERMREMIQNIE